MTGMDRILSWGTTPCRLTQVDKGVATALPTGTSKLYDRLIGCPWSPVVWCSGESMLYKNQGCNSPTHQSKPPITGEMEAETRSRPTFFRTCFLGSTCERGWAPLPGVSCLASPLTRPKGQGVGDVFASPFRAFHNAVETLFGRCFTKSYYSPTKYLVKSPFGCFVDLPSKPTTGLSASKKTHTHISAWNLLELHTAFVPGVLLLLFI